MQFQLPRCWAPQNDLKINKAFVYDGYPLGFTIRVVISYRGKTSDWKSLNTHVVLNGILAVVLKYEAPSNQ